MLQIKTFVFNPVMVNTYVLYDETKKAVIIDCGAYSPEEKKQVVDFIKEKGLILKHLLVTHLHYDHMLGSRFIFETYGLQPEYHRAEDAVLGLGKLNVILSPIKYEAVPAGRFIEHEEEVVFGNTRLKALLVPGHSLGSLSYYSEKNNCVFTGDALFYHDIGRTDLPGGNHKKLITSIENHLFTLPDDTVVYPGHAMPTTIEEEKSHNPYF